MNRSGMETLVEAKDIINRLAIAIKIAQTYSMDNQAVAKAADSFLELLNPLLKTENRIEIELLGDYFYVNEARVRHSVQYYGNFDFLVSEFRKRELGSIGFTGYISINEMLEFIAAFISCIKGDAPYLCLERKIERMGPVDIGPMKEVRQDSLTDVRRMVTKTYFNAVSSIKSIVTNARDGANVNIRKVRLAVHSLIDVMLSEENMLVNMTAIKDYDEYTFYHSVNVSILSLAIGMRLGMSRKQLSELGIAAMLHDIGKLKIPDSVLNKTTAFTYEDWELMRSHPVEGVDIIMGSLKIDNVIMISAIVAFEHHLYYDGSGYPPIKDFGKTDLFSNIITIADHFDAMTSARVYSRIPKPPELALRILFESSGIDFDPAVVKIFVRLIGCFPIGSMVLLDTREMGVVFYGNHAFPDRPIVRLLIDSNGNRMRNQMVDLSEKDESGAYLRTIKRTIDPFKYGINVAEYLGETELVAS
jgi:HD-GYP domain-containing protein (c-di-GMP phosphodiesterase class II)